MTSSDRPILYINAANVHRGGGAVLLSALLCAEFPRAGIVASVDERFRLDGTPRADLQIHRVRPTIAARVRHERWLSRAARDRDVVLCFGNLPPLFDTPGGIAVFLQNRYLGDSISTRGFPLPARMRIAVERAWLRRRSGHAHVFYVQTHSMREAVEHASLADRQAIEILPFVPSGIAPAHGSDRMADTKPVEATFLYVASGEPHKNHRNLVDAWCLLADAGVHPKLYLTLEPADAPDLYDWIEDRVRTRNLRIDILGNLPRDRLLTYFEKSNALIFPSLFESYGLPLVEARHRDLRILAPELDYVRDVVEPTEVFDPKSPRSIARAVRRFIGLPDPPPVPLTASQFLEAVWQRTRQRCAS